MEIEYLPELEVTPTKVMAPRARDGRKMRTITIAAFRREMTDIFGRLASLADGEFADIMCVIDQVKVPCSAGNLLAGVLLIGVYEFCRELLCIWRREIKRNE